MQFKLIIAALFTAQAVKLQAPRPTIFAQLYQPPTPAQVMEMVDTSGNGEIDQKEMMVAIKALAAEHDYTLTKDDIKEAKQGFKDADADGNGEVNLKELTKAMAEWEWSH